MKYKNKKIAVNRIAAAFMALLLVPSMLGYVKKSTGINSKRHTHPIVKVIHNIFW